MCGRYILAQKLETIEKRFNIKAPDVELTPSYNISPGCIAPVIVNQDKKELRLFRFGLTPFWAKKPMYLFNARSEGDRNKANDPTYKGSRDIINKPAFRKPIRSKRCLVIADAFIEGTTKDGLKKPFLVYLRNKERPFSFAGIWDEWKNEKTGGVDYGFSIITTTANSLLQKFPHHRSPVILSKKDEQKWLRKNLSLSDVTSLLEPYPSELMNAYPISEEIKNPKNNNLKLIQPLGQTIEKENAYKNTTYLELQGMGSGKKRNIELKN
ncbi:MAG: SOS response-associated peptidase [Marinilabiliales bacterium]|nr:MAG: SOS response-associated peptidase [Marinilabiliales bacterium]